jgi:hypothetical protein
VGGKRMVFQMFAAIGLLMITHSFRISEQKPDSDEFTEMMLFLPIIVTIYYVCKIKDDHRTDDRLFDRRIFAHTFSSSGASQYLLPPRSRRR